MLRRLLIVCCFTSAAFADTAPYDFAPINYSKATPHDPATELQAKLESGKISFDNVKEITLLSALLRELSVPVDSQTLVFSKTSLQRNRIGPDNPRAIYFNDDTYVGFVPGGHVIEIATTDPQLGSVFYTIDQQPTDGAKISRQIDNCMECHATNMTRDLPGLMVRSVYPNSSGDPITSAGGFVTTNESPLKERWGGWYVTGSLPGDSMANLVFDDSDPVNPKPQPALEPGKAYDPGAYLSPNSDPVALLVLGHQVEAHNRLTRALYATRRALYEEDLMNKALGAAAPKGHSDSILSRIHHACDPLVEYFLFSGEPTLPDKVVGTSTFAQTFPRQGPRDPQGRSLRDFDLETRLFKYPCSYLIYSKSFDQLPGPALDYIYQRLYDVLTGKDDSKQFAHLTSGDRRNILDILRATKKNLPAYWQN